MTSREMALSNASRDACESSLEGCVQSFHEEEEDALAEACSAEFSNCVSCSTVAAVGAMMKG